MIDWATRIDAWIRKIIGAGPQYIEIQRLPPMIVGADLSQASIMRLIVKPPAGVLNVAGNWRHVKATLGGSGVYGCQSGSQLWKAFGDLWTKGSTKTWIGGMSGPGASYARIKLNGEGIGAARFDQDVSLSIPKPENGIGFVTFDGPKNSAEWVWMGEKVWYNVYQGKVRLEVLPIGPAWQAGTLVVRPIIHARLGQVGWYLDKWQRDSISSVMKLAQGNVYGKVWTMIMGWLAGKDPDKGLGLKLAQQLEPISFTKKS
jgi:hypothetical protein